MWTPVRLNNGKRFEYGFGWQVTNINRHRLVAHSGSMIGFTAYIGRFVDDKLTVIVFANRAGFSTTRLGEGIAAIYNPELAQPAEEPALKTAPPLKPGARLTKSSPRGDYIPGFNTGRFCTKSEGSVLHFRPCLAHADSM
jgi:hypothetical protein